MRTTLILAALLLATAAQARDLTPAEEQSLEAAVAEFSAAMEQRDYEEMTRATPPRLVAALADAGGVGVEELRAAIVEQLRGTEDVAKIESYSMDLEAATRHEASDGTPYVLIPTVTNVALAATGATVRADAQTLAMLDGDAWYLVNADEPMQMQMLQQAYPEFEGVTIPAGTMTEQKDG